MPAKVRKFSLNCTNFAYFLNSLRNVKSAFDLHDRSRIYIGAASELLAGLLPEGRTVAVADAAFLRAHGALLAPYETLEVSLDESTKTVASAEALCRRLLDRGVDRQTFLLVAGGGVTTDTAGFVASTYMRGLRFGFLSTTLLGQVDAAVGGKNGVNLDGYKNMIGTFSQPEFVLCDPGLLATLPPRELRAGLAELIKAAIIADADLFARLEAVDFETLTRDRDLLADAVSAAVRVKVDIVGRDERETGERRKLNLGHTLAHAIEKCSSAMNHGEAVAVGTDLIAGAAERMGLLSAADRARIAALLGRMGFDLRPPVAVGQLLREVARDKKREGDLLHIVLPAGIGDCTVRPMPVEAFAALFSCTISSE